MNTGKYVQKDNRIQCSCNYKYNFGEACNKANDISIYKEVQEPC